MSEKYVLVEDYNTGSSYYNGLNKSGWGYMYVKAVSSIDPKYIYNSKEAIEKLPLYRNKLSKRFKIVAVSSINVKPECPYMRQEIVPSKILSGKCNEICSICGSNILANEEYLKWRDGNDYCLHCVMNRLSNILELYEDVPPEFKAEWEKTGKNKAEQCTEFI